MKKNNSIVIALLFFTVVLLICLIGYETMKESWSPGTYAEKKAKSKKSLRIVTGEGNEGYKAYTSPIQQRQVKTAAPPSYPMSQKIPDIEKSIIANEMLHNKAHSTIRQLEKELADANKKIETLDGTLDTITRKIEITRSEKEKLESQYQNQVAQIQQQNSAEKEELKNSLQDSIANQYILRKTIDEKIAKINDLTNELADQRSSMESQAKDIARLNQDLITARDNFDYERAQGIYLKGEIARSKEELQESYSDITEFEKELNVAIDVEKALRETITQIDTTVALKEFEINSLINAFADAKKEMNTEVQDIVFFLNWEKNRAENMHHELRVALGKYDIEKQKVAALESSLSDALMRLDIESSIASSQKLELSSLLDAFNEHKVQALEKVANLSYLFESEHIVAETALKKWNEEQELTAMLQEKLNLARQKTSEFESTFAEQTVYFNRKEAELTENMQALRIALLSEKVKVQELTENLQRLASTYDDERQKSQDLQEVLLSSMEKTIQLEEELANERSVLAARENEIILQRHELVDEHKRTDEAFAALHATELKVIESEKQVALLESLLNEEKHKIAFLETQLGTQFAASVQKEKEYETTVAELSKNLHEQKIRTLDLYVTLEDTMAKYSKDGARYAEIEQIISEKDAKMKTSEAELAILRKLSAEKEQELLGTIQDLKVSLFTEEARHQDINNALQAAFSQQLVEEQRAAELEFRLTTAVERAAQLEHSLAEQQKIIALKEEELKSRPGYAVQERANELEVKLIDALSLLKVYETELADKKAKIFNDEQYFLSYEVRANESMQLEKDKAHDLESKLSIALEKARQLESELTKQRALEHEMLARQEGSDMQLQNEINRVSELAEKLSITLEKTHSLELELNDHRQMVQNKEFELQAKQNELTTGKEQIQELEGRLSQAQEKAQQFEKDLAEQRAIVAANVKEQEFQKARSNIVIHNEQQKATELERDLLVYSERTRALQSELIDLKNVEQLTAGTLHHEQQKAMHLERELLSYREKAKALQERTTLLEQELNQQVALILETDKQLQLHEKNAAIALANEQKRSSDLESQLSVYTNRIREMQEKAVHMEMEVARKDKLIADAEKERKSQESHKNVALEDHQRRVTELQLEVSEQSAKAHILSEKATALEQELMKQLTRNVDLQKEHQLAIQYEQNKAVMLEKELKANATKLRALESDLMDQQSLVQKKEMEIESYELMKSKELSALKDKVNDLETNADALAKAEMDSQAQLAHQQKLWETKMLAFQEELQSEKERYTALENSLKEMHNQRVALENELNGKKAVIAEYEMQVKLHKMKEKEANQLAHELSQEKAYSTTIYETLQQMLAKFDQEQQHAEKLEEQLKTVSAQAKTAQHQLEQQNTLMHSLEKQQHEMNEHYAARLEEVMEQLNQERLLREQVANELRDVTTNYSADQEYKKELEKRVFELSARDE